MKIEQFNPKNLREIRTSLEAVLEVVSEEYGVVFKAGNISYSNDTFKCVIESTIVPDGMSKDQVQYNKVCHLFDLKESDYLKTFSSGGNTYELIGLKPRSPKYSVVARNVMTGARYKFGSSVLKRLTS